MAKRSGSRVMHIHEGGANRKLIDALNEDLSQELQAITRYIVYAATVRGPSRPAISSLFRSEITDELSHASMLADKIAALGGRPRPVCHDVEPANTAKEMLEVVLQSEEEAIAIYRRHLQLADQSGDIALRVQFENMIADETRHAEEMQKILADWR